MEIRQTFTDSFALLVGTVVLAALTTACASTGAVPQPFPRPSGSRGPLGSTAPQGAPGSESSQAEPEPRNLENPENLPNPGNLANLARNVVGTALSLRGTPYRNGGMDPNGFDCSGFTQYVFSLNGVELPREVRAQFEIGEPVEPAEISAGDLLFFSTTTRDASHVGIAIGGDAFIHAPSSTGVVRVERVSAAYWSRRFLGARRVS